MIQGTKSGNLVCATSYLLLSNELPQTQWLNQFISYQLIYCLSLIISYLLVGNQAGLAGTFTSVTTLAKMGSHVKA